MILCRDDIEHHKEFKNGCPNENNGIDVNKNHQKTV